MSKYGTVKLGTVTKIRTGKLDVNASSPDGIYPFFTCSKYPTKISSFSYDCECVLVAGNGDLNVKYYNGKFDAYQRTYIIESIDKNKLFVPYLYYFLNKYVEVLRVQSIGGVIKYIKLGNLTDAIIPLPPLNTQKKITKNLDIASELISMRKQQLAELDNLIKSTFYDMFGDPVINEKGWELTNLGNCLDGIESGWSPNCYGRAVDGDEWGVCKLSAVTGGYYKEKENKAIIEGTKIREELEVKRKDLLLTRKNTIQLVGSCAYVFKTNKRLMIPDTIFRLCAKSNIDKLYIWGLFNWPAFKPIIQNLATGSSGSMPNISKAKLQQLIIPLPSFEMQKQFAEVVTKIEEQKALVQKAIDETQHLFDSLMSEYFD